MSDNYVIIIMITMIAIIEGKRIIMRIYGNNSDLVVLSTVWLASRRYGLNAENDGWPIVIDAAINIFCLLIAK